MSPVRCIKIKKEFDRCAVTAFFRVQTGLMSLMIVDVLQDERKHPVTSMTGRVADLLHVFVSLITCSSCNAELWCCYVSNVLF